MRRWFFVVFLIGTGASWAHERRHGEPPTAQPANVDRTLFDQIDGDYRATIEPIFRQKCFNCHSSDTRYPWYYRLPVARQIIDRDIREGREHIDFSNGFPFGGHGTPMEDLKAIREAVEKDTMPLPRYLWLHRNSSLTAAEKQTILDWIGQSEKLLEEK